MEIQCQAFTDTDAAWSEPDRSRFLRNFWVGHQVPPSLPCDRIMVFDARDGLYLEGMVEFLSGKRNLPTSVGSKFWTFDLPSPSPSGKRTVYDYLRTQLAVTYGFGHIITFPEHDALRVNEGASAQFDVLTAVGARQTKYRAPLDRFPALPLWITGLRLPGGLCMRIPRILHYEVILYFYSLIFCYGIRKLMLRCGRYNDTYD